jgi:streptomycin 6-kinase
VTERGAAIDVPAAVRRKAVVAGAEGWLAGLPGLIAGLEREWSVTVGRPYPDATEALVLRAKLADGTPGVLKLLVPRDGGAGGHGAGGHGAGDGGGLAAQEITVLRLAGGRGCAALLRADPARGALLLERLGRSMHELRLPLARRLDLLCAAVMPLWRPAAGCGLPTAPGTASGWLATLSRAGRSWAAPVLSGPSITRWPARGGGSRRTMTSARSWCTGTCTSGTRWSPQAGGTRRVSSGSWTRTACSPRRNASWAC